MDKHRKLSRLVAAAASAALVAAFAAPASAETQDVTATINSSIAMTTAPDATVDLGNLNPGQTGTASGGTLGVTANVAYVVGLTSSDPQMTGTEGSLAADLAVAATATSGTGVGAATTSSVAEAGAFAIATGTGLSDDEYSLQLSQLASVTDAPGTYGLTLTYTAGATL